MDRHLFSGGRSLIGVCGVTPNLLARLSGSTFTAGRDQLSQCTLQRSMRLAVSAAMESRTEA